MTLRKNFLWIIVVMLFYQFTEAQIDTIHIDKKDLIMSNLKEGTDQYLVYTSRKNQVMISSIWSRETRFEKFNGQNVVVVSQTWLILNNKKKRERELLSISNASNFAPIYHYVKTGPNRIEAFDFHKKEIVGSDSIAKNFRKDFRMQMSQPTLNWELDMEVFKTLDYSRDKVYAISFYHPGSKQGPKYYNYKVIREEILKGVKGDIDCWVMEIDFGMSYGKPSKQTFWIDKKSKSTVKMYGFFGDIERYKLKIGSII